MPVTSKSRIYFGKISHETTERDVKKFFKNYGEITSIAIKYGYAFIDFQRKEDAEDACNDLDNKEFLGSRCVVQMSFGFDRNKEGPVSRQNFSFSNAFDEQRCSEYYNGGNRGYPSSGNYAESSRPYNTKYSLTVENVSSRTSWKELKDYFRSVGEVTFADAHRIAQNVGRVDFARKQDMRDAIRKLDKTDLNGRTIRIICNYQSEHRESSRPTSRLRSRSPKRKSRRSQKDI